MQEAAVAHVLLYIDRSMRLAIAILNFLAVVVSKIPFKKKQIPGEE